MSGKVIRYMLANDELFHMGVEPEEILRYAALQLAHSINPRTTTQAWVDHVANCGKGLNHDVPNGCGVREYSNGRRTIEVAPKVALIVGTHTRAHACIGDNISKGLHHGLVGLRREALQWQRVVWLAERLAERGEDPERLLQDALGMSRLEPSGFKSYIRYHFGGLEVDE